MRFLVVDDSPTMRRIVINGLKVFGYTNTIEAGDGQEALMLLKQNEVDFILTDYNMPNMNGLELTKSVRSNERYKHIPIIMITTRGAKNDIIECLKAKVNNYIVKPFTPQILKEKIDLVLKKEFKK